MLAFVALIRHPGQVKELFIKQELMMARLRTRWNQKERERGIDQVASAVGVSLWRIASEALLNLENEGFETITHAQRLDVIAEFLAFLIHVSDRLVYGKSEEQQRREFITALAMHLTNLMQDNRRDASGPGQYREAFIELLNARMEDYSQCSFSESEGPGFTLKRILGEQVRDRMGAKDNKWIPDYVMDAEVPKAMESLHRVLKGMLNLAPEDRRSPVPKGGVWGEG